MISPGAGRAVGGACGGEHAHSTGLDFVLLRHAAREHQPHTEEGSTGRLRGVDQSCGVGGAECEVGGARCGDMKEGGGARRGGGAKRGYRALLFVQQWEAPGHSRREEA
ncbi:unnamed protein product [Boreogadus saida]